MDFIQSALETLNQVFEAGIAITALSLFIRALSFNLRDRVSRSFAVVLACIVVNFAGEAISGSVSDPSLIEIWLRINWIGVLFLPPAILHFSDALLETTGRPSRGRRRRVILISYGLSFGLFVSTFTANFLGPVVIKEGVYPHLGITPFSIGFAVYYLIAMILGGRMIWRAYRRTRLRVSRRRIRYMLTGVIFLAIGSYPYLQLGTGLVQSFNLPFLLVVFTGNIGIFMTLVLMAYAVGFFGISWPDRVVRSRLLKWLMRGPFTVFVVILLITIAYRVGDIYGTPYSVAIPIITALTVLFLEHLTTLVFPLIERWFFHGGEHQNLSLLQTLSERIITTGDLRQYLEAVLAAVCDRFQVSTAFIAALEESGMEMVVNIGKELNLDQNDLDQVVLEKVVSNQENGGREVFSWGDFWVLPLRGSEEEDLLGLLGVRRLEEHRQQKELFDALEFLGERAGMGLEDRRIQQQVFEGLETLKPKVDLLQRMRAAVRYDQSGIMGGLEDFGPGIELSQWVKDALSHYWGGPKLTESPLMGLKIVQESMEEHNGNPTNAMRAILKKAVEQVKPEGERRFTAEWILYNILEMKFMEGRKVREIALRLAMSEADLYRKQRVAIEAVAQAIMDMELKAREA